MKKYIMPFLWGLLVFFTACSDDDTPTQPTQQTYVPLNEITQQMNNLNIGNYTGDAQYDYFQYYEDGKVGLYKKERENGTLTLLDQREGSETIGKDVFYNHLYLYGEYLYFTLFDYHTDNWQDVLCRVPVNGRRTMEQITSLRGTSGIYLYRDGNAYIISNGALYEVNLQNGIQTMLSELPSSNYPALFVDNYLYTYEYTFTSDGKFYIKLNRMKIDGSGQQTILDNPDFSSITLTALNNRLYMVNNNVLYSTTLEGDDLRKHLELTDEMVWSVNVSNEALYLLASDESTGSHFKIYVYQPTDEVLRTSYQADNLMYYFMLNGYGEVILPTSLETSRFGQLNILRDGMMYNIKE